MRALAFIDRLDRLEQLGWVPSAQEWLDLRQICNEFSREYPDTPPERLARLEAAIASAGRILEIFERLEQAVAKRFFPL